VTFADHQGSTKSYAYVKEHDQPLHGIDFVPYFEDIHVDYPAGTTREVRMPDGSHIVLQKLAEDYDPTDRDAAFAALREARRTQRLVTGLLYVEPGSRPHDEELQLVDTPLARLPLEAVRPSREVLTGIMEQLQTGRGLEAPAGGG
jgi:2-oxoglutarate ferredoxin oxidoreductase subunit beta